MEILSLYDDRDAMPRVMDYDDERISGSTAEDARMFLELWTKMDRVVMHFIRVTTDVEADRKDMCQNAMIELWRVDRGRYDATLKEDVRYVRAIVIRKTLRRYLADRRKLGHDLEAPPADLVRQLRAS